MNQLADILGGIIMLAIIGTVVGSSNTAKDVTALGKAFTNAIKAATGK